MPYSGQKIFPILNVNLNHFDIIGWNSNGIALIGSSGNILAHKKLVFLLWFLYIQVIYSYIKLLVNWMFLLLLEFLILSIELLLYSRPKKYLKSLQSCVGGIPSVRYSIQGSCSMSTRWKVNWDQRSRQLCFVFSPPSLLIGRIIKWSHPGHYMEFEIQLYHG